ncbi:LysR family transcriptional regulator [Sphingobium sp. CR28]|uniref:LysR family transcriptional regulator n=1 Tax=Sphingobium sp. CR28 TaxID=3400272 RepID=UPI003FF11F09
MAVLASSPALSLWSFNLRHLAAVAAVVNKGSVSAAAGTIHLTQPAVTQAIARVESQLGIKLFERRANGMNPLPVAHMFAERIQAALALIGSRRVTTAQWRAFLAVAYAGSYVAAANRTGLSEPTLHRAISDLSLIMRRSLIERRGRGITLTEAGRRIARTFRLAQAELQAGLEEIVAPLGGTSGYLAIGAMPLARARVLPQAVARFSAGAPSAEIRIVEGARDELVEPLRDGRIDLMIGALRNPAADPDVEQRPLFTDAPIIIGRAGHPLAGTSPSFASMRRYPWIVGARGTPLRSGFEAMFADAAVPLPEVPIECGSVMMIREILLQTDFLTVLSPYQVSVELQAGWLVQIAASPERFHRIIGVTTRTGWRPSPSQARFLQALDEAAEEQL